MSRRDDELSALAGSILDGRPVDWDAFQSTGGADEGIVRQLRVLAAVAEAHRVPSSSADSPVFELPLPSLWGLLEVREHIGRGSFGDVYKAWDPRLDRAVALKLFPAQGTDAGTSSPMLDEGRRLARVRHPNVVTIHGADQIDGRVGLWMEFVQGQTLAQALDERGSFSDTEVVAMGLTICRALAAVHEAGLLHRDIKPQNVMVEPGGRLVLMDFGTGREIAGATPELAGTPLYLAPEVLDGEPATVRSDLYSVGVLLYRLLSGAYPVTGETVHEIRDNHRTGQHVPLRTVRADVPGSLANIVERATDPRPEARYASAPEMADALAAAGTRSMTPVRRSVVAALLAAAVLAVAFTGLRVFSPPNTGLDFQARDWVLIVPFDNRTNETVLDGTLESALEQELTNSAFVNVVPRERIEDVFSLMRKPMDSVVDQRLGREVALRDGAIHALITGRIDKIGARYHTRAQIVDPADGSVVVSLAEEAATQSDLLPAMRRQALKIRSALGEMLRTVRQSESALERVTTPSLHAAQLYSRAAAFMRGDGAGELRPAGEFLKQAVEEDLDFASAYNLLAWVAQRQGRPKEEYLSHAERALTLASRASDVERYFITGTYHDLLARSMGEVGVAEGDRHRQLAMAAYEALLRIKPDHYWAIASLGNLYTALRFEPRATQFLERIADLRPTNPRLRWFVAQRLFERGDYERGVLHLQKAKALITPELVAAHPEYDSTIYRLGVAEAWLPMDAKRVRELTDARARRIAVLGSGNAETPGMNLDLVGIYNALGRPHDAERAAQNVPEALRAQAVGQVRFTEAGAYASQGKPGAKDALLRHLTTVYPNLETIPAAPLWAGSLVLVGRLDALRAAVERARPEGYVVYNGGRFRWHLFAAEARLALAEGHIEEATRLFQLAADNGGPPIAQDSGTPVLIANAWIARANRRRAIDVLEDATRERWAASAVGLSVTWPSSSMTLERIIWSRTETDAGIGVRVSAWMRAANRLAELYREEGRRQEADALDTSLRKLLAEAEPDFPLLVALKARFQAP